MMKLNQSAQLPDVGDLIYIDYESWPRTFGMYLGCNEIDDTCWFIGSSIPGGMARLAFIQLLEQGSVKIVRVSHV